LWALWLVLLAALLVMGNSRAAWVGAFAGAVVFVVLALAAYGLLSPAALAARVRTLPRWGQAALALAALALAVAFVAALPLIVFRATDMTQHGALAKRVDIWRVAVSQFGSTPLFGRGPFTYGDAYLERISSPPETPHAHAHSLPLNFAAEEGLLGLLVLAWLGWTAWVAVRKRFLSSLPVGEGVVERSETGGEGQEKVLLQPSPQLDGATAASLLAAVVTNNLFDFTLVPGVALLALWSLVVLLPDGTSAFVPGVKATTLRRWAAPLLWLAALGLWAFPLPSAQAAADALDAASQGQWAAAAESYELAVQRAPALTVYRFDAAYTYAQLALEGDDVALARAIELYIEALAIRPEFPLHWADLALLEYRAGHTESALAAMQTAAQRAPDAPLFGELAGVMARDGDLSAVDAPSFVGFGEGDTYSVHGFHVPGPGVFLLPLPETEATP
jgi:tetratricopeptide (TPR) repeat protein